jgi:hypothetical protein
MPGAIIQTVSSLLKDVYLPPVVEQLNNEVELLSRLEKVKDFQMVGNQVVVPLHTNRSGGIGSRTESGGNPPRLPDAGNQTWARAVYDLTYHYGRIQVSGAAMAKTKAQVGSFLDVLKSEMDFLKNDLRKDLARQVWGPSDGNTTGGNGRIVTCGSTSSSSTVVLNSAEPLRKGHLYVGMRVDIGTAGSPTSLINGEAITAVNVATPSITVTTAITTTTSNFVCRAGNAGNEINNLQTVIADAANTFGGINAASAGNEYWDNNRDLTATTLSLDRLQQMWNTIRVKGNKTPSILLTTPAGQRIYYNLLQSQVRYTEPLKIKSGYDKEALAFNNSVLIDDVDARFGRVYFVDTDHIKNFSNEDWHWLAEDGDVLKWVTNYDAWEAGIATYFQLGVDRRNTMGVLTFTGDTTGV